MFTIKSFCHDFPHLNQTGNNYKQFWYFTQGRCTINTGGTFNYELYIKQRCLSDGAQGPCRCINYTIAGINTPREAGVRFNKMLRKIYCFTVSSLFADRVSRRNSNFAYHAFLYIVKGQNEIQFDVIKTTWLNFDGEIL